MKNKFLNILLSGLMVVGMASPVLATNANTLPTSSHTTNIHLHKKQFVAPATYDAEKQNTGDVIRDFGGEPYNKAKYGPVKFTLYKINENHTAYTTGKAGNTSLQEIANSLYTELKDTHNFNPPADFGTKVEEVEVNETGDIQFAPVQTATQGAYLIVETVSPASVVGKAAPILIELPVVNQERTGFLTDVHLYPKNKITPITVTLTKKGKSMDTTPLQVQDGVSFDLYKQNQDGDYEKVNQTALVTNDQGQITVSDVGVGNYRLVETAAKQGYLLSEYAMNDTSNQIWFSVSEAGVLTQGDKVAELVNYEKPTITKENDADLTNGTDVTQTVNYSVRIPVPNNFFEYEKLTYHDVPNAAINIDESSFALKIVRRGEDRAVTENTTFGVVDTLVKNRGDKDHFYGVVLQDAVSPDNKATYDVATIYGYELKNQDPTVTLQSIPENLKEPLYNGELEFLITYKARVKNVVGNFENKAYLDWQIHPSIKGVEVENAFVKTYGAKFEKLDGGRLGVAQLNKQALEGAEFVVIRQINGVNYYLDYTTNPRDIVEIQGVNEVFGEVSQHFTLGADEYYAFWRTDKAEAHRFVSDTNGVVEVLGLAKGVDYYLEEVKAPVNYRLPVNTLHRFNAQEVTAKDQLVATAIYNRRTEELPMTGSDALYVASAIGVVGTGLAFVLKRKKKEEK